MEEKSPRKNLSKQRLLRCADWLKKQDPKEYEELGNDVEFVMASENKSNISLIDENATTVPDGVEEIAVKPVKVPLKKLRKDRLHMVCEWKECNLFTNNYEIFQKHVSKHILQVKVTEVGGSTQLACLWDICGFKTTNFEQMTRHINYHAYHANLLAVGFNGRATLKLMRCKKDSSKRNILPELVDEHQCRWTGCDGKFNAIQVYFDHVNQHAIYSEKHLCSWAGCGATFPNLTALSVHLRSHCGMRVIACYHCGVHFANNRRLADHLRRQNVDPSLGLTCSMCGVAFATQYLLNEHARRHVSIYACALCDMSAPSRASLASHVAYRHMDNRKENRPYKCPQCDHRSVTKWDLRKHIAIHAKKNPKNNEDSTDSEDNTAKPAKVKKQYICHMCPEEQNKIYTTGGRLTNHLIKVHGIQWPCGHSRFRYQISEDGMYRLTTTRYESLEVSRKICESSGSREQIMSTFDFEIEEKSEATDRTPKHFVVKIKNDKIKENAVEITMCDVDEDGNIISSEVIKSDVVYT